MTGMSCAFDAGVQDAGGFYNAFVGSWQGLCGVIVTVRRGALAFPPQRPHNQVERFQDW